MCTYVLKIGSQYVTMQGTLSARQQDALRLPVLNGPSTATLTPRLVKLTPKCSHTDPDPSLPTGEL